jgi:hypothetical protein
MLRTLVSSFALAAAIFAGPLAHGQERTRDAVRPDCDEAAALGGDGCVSTSREGAPSYDDLNRASAGGANDAGRSAPYDPAARPYVNFQTGDWRFDAIMNRVGNNPGVYACVAYWERSYVLEYIAAHPGVEGAVRDHDLSRTCPAGHPNAGSLTLVQEQYDR